MSITKEQERVIKFIKYLEERGYIKFNPKSYYDWEEIIISCYGGLSIEQGEKEEPGEDWKAKVMFYREQTDKLRLYIHEKRIGKPTQGFFDILLERIEQLEALTHLPAISEQGVKKEAEKRYPIREVPTQINSREEDIAAATIQDWNIINKIKQDAFIAGAALTAHHPVQQENKKSDI